jgi:Holliday junction DNA helicase RuvA
MIAKLTGLIDLIGPDFLILDVNGVGYQVFASRRTLSRIGGKGDRASLLIDTQVREDHIHLFGFADAAEQQWYKLLTTVQGVGAKAALAILGVCDPGQLGFAIAAGDAHMLRQAEGVGPKLATRIVTELKDKASKMDLTPAAMPLKKNGKSPATETPPEDAGVEHDAVSALVNLGYGRTDAYAAVREARGNDNDLQGLDLQGLIRLALKELSA